MSAILEILWWSFVVIVALFILLSGAVNEGKKVTDKDWIKAAIERGYGQYCPKDGAFAWKGECVE